MLSQTTLMSSPFERENRRRRDERIPEDLATRRSYVNTFRFIITLVNPLIFIFIFRLLFRLIITPVQEYITGFTLRPNNPAKKKQAVISPPLSHSTPSHNTQTRTHRTTQPCPCPHQRHSFPDQKLWPEGTGYGPLETLLEVFAQSSVSA